MKRRSLLQLCKICIFIFLILSLGCTQASIPATENAGETTATSSQMQDKDIITCVSIPDETIGIGKQGTISIFVELNTAIAGMQFDMSFDPSLISIDSIEEGDLFTQDGANTFFNSGVIDNVSGTISTVCVAIISPGETVSKEGTFALINFTAGTTKTFCPLTLSNVILGDIEARSVPVNIVNGELEIC